jgi:anti-sigma regulatory factor (Ser/Thr protein kinase)
MCEPAPVRWFCAMQAERPAAVTRAEDASVSHDQLLAGSGNAGARAAYLPPELARIMVRGPQCCGEAAAGDVLSCSLPPLAESARRARDFTRTALLGWGMGNLGDMAVLVVSELVTNALRHAVLSGQWMPGEHPIALSLLRRDAHLLCMVSDPSSSGPVRVSPDAAAEGGRGLQIVESCTVTWGWQPTGVGKVVWALLRLAGSPPRLLPHPGRLGNGARDCGCYCMDGASGDKR